MDTIINWFRELSRNVQIIIILVLCLFTPLVSVAFELMFGFIGAAFSIIGFVLGFINWGVAFMLALGFGGYWLYQWVNNNDEEIVDEEDDEDDSWDPFR